MTSDGNPYARFRRALETGNETLVITAARELPQVRLDDALRICLVLRGGDPDRYERAAVRWLGRFALEAREATINDLRLAAERARRAARACHRGDGAAAAAVRRARGGVAGGRPMVAARAGRSPRADRATGPPPPARTPRSPPPACHGHVATGGPQTCQSDRPRPALRI